VVGTNGKTVEEAPEEVALVQTSVVHNLREDFDVYIGREVPEHRVPASKWGNPFVMEDESDAARERAIAAYRGWVVQQPDLMGSLEELRGRRLGCWCAPKRCHGDVLVELIESLREPE
jgi:hypothetical protein